MSTPFLGEIRMVAFNFPPTGWALCNGQLLSIAQNQALFSLLGTTYGGDGITTFGLPNLQGMVPIHRGNGFSLGRTEGEATHTLTAAELPAHSHVARASSNAPDQLSPANNFWANPGVPSYSDNAPSLMSAQASGPVGANQPHENLSPYLVLNFAIALQGIFPSRN